MDRVKRIEEYVRLFMCHPSGLNTEQIAKALEIDVVTVYRDLDFLSSVPEYEYFGFAQHAPWEDEDGDIDDFLPEPDKLSLIRWSLAIRRTDYLQSPLSPRQVALLMELLASFPDDNEATELISFVQENFHTPIASEYKAFKTIGLSPFYQSATETGILETVDTALAKTRKLGFKSPDGSPVVILPLGLVYFESTRGWYILTRAKPGKVRYIPLRDINEPWLGEVFPYPDDFDLLEELQVRWGPNPSDQEVYVEVEFYQDTNNLFEKARSYLYRHCPPCTIEERDNRTLAFSGPVKSLADFRQWVQIFGASAKVIKPVELRQQIIEITRKVFLMHNTM